MKQTKKFSSKDFKMNLIAKLLPLMFSSRNINTQWDWDLQRMLPLLCWWMEE